MKFLISIIVGITVFLTVGISLDNSTYMHSKYILLLAQFFGLIAFVMTLYKIKNGTSDRVNNYLEKIDKIIAPHVVKALKDFKKKVESRERMTKNNKTMISWSIFYVPILVFSIMAIAFLYNEDAKDLILNITIFIQFLFILSGVRAAFLIKFKRFWIKVLTLVFYIPIILYIYLALSIYAACIFGKCPLYFVS